MEYIPLVIIYYGYYSGIRKIVKSYYNIKWTIDKTKQIANYIKPSRESWEFVDDIHLVEPEDTNVFVLTNWEDFIRIDPFTRQNNSWNPSQ